jgi:hypothetical protein
MKDKRFYYVFTVIGVWFKLINVRMCVFQFILIGRRYINAETNRMSVKITLIGRLFSIVNIA